MENNSEKIIKYFFDYCKKNKFNKIKDSFKILNNKDNYYDISDNDNLLKILINEDNLKQNIYGFSKYIRGGGLDNYSNFIGNNICHNTLNSILFTLTYYNKYNSIKLLLDYLIDKLKLNKDNLYIVYNNKEIYNYYYDIFVKYTNNIIHTKLNKYIWNPENCSFSGSCIKIFYDKKEGNRYIDKLIETNDFTIAEICNIKFLNNKNNDNYIYTELYFENLLTVIENKISIYETDIFDNSIKEIEKNISQKYNETMNNRKYFRIVVDHLRTIAICSNEDIYPDNNRLIIKNIFHKAIRLLRFNLKSINNLSIDIIKIILQNINISELKYDTIITFLKKKEIIYYELVERTIKLMENKINNKDYTDNDIYNSYKNLSIPNDLIIYICNIHNIDSNIYIK